MREAREQGHPLAAKLWGPLIGPVLAVVSFVCSIGNVPLAVVLWKGDISFGGVVAFIFADTWLNIVLLALAAALIIRFVRTGGVAMLRMMGGPPDTHEHDHSDSHASHGD